MPARLPLADLETLFLDAGNTLVSIDFAWVSRELAARDVSCDPAALWRAEASARPHLSAAIKRMATTEGLDVFAVHLGAVLRGVETLALADDHVEALVSELVPILRAPGLTQRLWSNVLPGVPEALGRCRALGLQLVVVSNSDGSVEQGLIEQGLRDFFDVVIDSHVVGFEKPDPRIYVHALERSGATAETTLHVGDLYDADVTGARAAGVHPLLLDPFDDWGPVDCARLPDVPTLVRHIEEARASGGS